MAGYCMIAEDIGYDARVEGLSHQGHRLLMQLMYCSGRTRLGVRRWRPADALAWSPEVWSLGDVEAALDELVGVGLVYFDARARLLWVTITHLGPVIKGHNNIKGAATQALEFPDSRILIPLLELLLAEADWRLAQLREAETAAAIVRPPKDHGDTKAMAAWEKKLSAMRGDLRLIGANLGAKKQACGAAPEPPCKGVAAGESTPEPTTNGVGSGLVVGPAGGGEQPQDIGGGREGPQDVGNGEPRTNGVGTPLQGGSTRRRNGDGTERS